MQNKPVYIFDLDGTLLSINSFPKFVLYLLRGRFDGLSKAERLLLTMRTGWVLLQRKLLKKNHIICKRTFQRLWAEALAKDPNAMAQKLFLAEMMAFVRPNLREVLQKLAGEDCIFATAAAEEYGAALGKALGFSHILCSPDYRGEIGAENVREKKRDHVLAFLQTRGWQARQRIFFTDHEEDLPLMRESAHNFWLGGSHKLALLENCAVTPCANATSEEILAQILRVA